MFNEMQSLNLFPVSIFEIISNVFVALCCGLFIAWVYRKSYRGAGYSSAFVNSMIFLSMITAIVIMVIGNNLARAFGLVGAMSIIRFRTAVKDTQDIVFIFFALAIGMAAGVGYFKLAIFGSAFVGIIMLLLVKSNITALRQDDYLLQFSFQPNGDNSPPYMPILNKYCRRFNVVNTRTVEDHGIMELSYYVKLKNKEKNPEFISALDNTHGVKNINLFFDEEQI
ncbi:MAG: DUF4956 domain-containing protein [Calditrichaeota bacterium]|nr:MAG: DUF4956 domain-containing protein [Calditrichota bacterium]MBL1207034.1 DUF4956 domain-containing protein [Calditrichota bacterium]NOG46861.1 DUF4956 domain-containing protein [Calditrichota bacterium]